MSARGVRVLSRLLSSFSGFPLYLDLLFPEADELEHNKSINLHKYQVRVDYAMRNVQALVFLWQKLTE